MSATIGQPAPAFDLPDQNKERVSLDDLRGKRTLVMFIPFPFTGICDAEGCALRDGIGHLEALDAMLFGAVMAYVVTVALVY